MCQGCVDDGSITQEVHNAIEKFLDRCPEVENGLAHIVFGDDNVDDYCIQSCIDNFPSKPRSYQELEALEFLVDLIAWPIEKRLGPKGLKEMENE